MDKALRTPVLDRRGMRGFGSPATDVWIDRNALGGAMRRELRNLVYRSRRDAFLIILFGLMLVSLAGLMIQGLERLGGMTRIGLLMLLALGAAVAEGAMAFSEEFRPEVNTRLKRVIRKLTKPMNIVHVLGFAVAGIIQAPSLVIALGHVGKYGVSWYHVEFCALVGSLIGLVQSLDVILLDGNVVRFPNVSLPKLYRVLQSIVGGFRDMCRFATFFLAPCLGAAFLLSSSRPPLSHLPEMIVSCLLLVFSWYLTQRLRESFMTIWDAEMSLLETLTANENTHDHYMKLVCLQIVRRLAMSSKQRKTAFFSDATGISFDRTIKLLMEPIEDLQNAVRRATPVNGTHLRTKVQPLFWDARRVVWSIEAVTDLLVSARWEDQYGIGLPYIPLILAQLLSFYEALLLQSRTAKSFEEDAQEKAQGLALLDAAVRGAHRIIHQFNSSCRNYYLGTEPRWNSDLSPTLEKFLHFQEL